MSYFRTAVAATLALASFSVQAVEYSPRFDRWQEVIEPDDYAIGTDLSSVSPYVTLSTFNGAPVYASPLATKVGEDPLNGFDSGVLGDQVFSWKPDINSEWYYLYEGDDLLVATFSEPVAAFSITAAEVNGNDGNCCSSDPVILFVYLYDGDDNLVDKVIVNGTNAVTSYLGNKEDSESAHPVYLYQYSGKPVSRIMIAGESEPTTVDRLTFTPISKLPRLLRYYYSKWAKSSE